MGPRLTTAILGRVSRRAVALNPQAWRSVGACFFLFGLAAIAISLAIPPFQRTEVLIAGVLLACVAAFLLSRPAPDADSPVTHLAVAAVYVGTAGAMVAFAPEGSAPLPAVTFLGVVAAVWLDSNRQIVAHYLAATVLLLLPSVLGITDLTTLIATVILLPSSFILGLCARNVLNLAEAQGRRLERLAMRDPLTGVGNRRLLDERMEEVRARHAAIRRSFTLFALDLNGFKTINDTLGHAAGDRVLRDVARRLSTVMGEHATVSRLGGDEFAILLPLTDAEEAEAIAEEVRAALGPTIRTGIGWATYPQDGRDADTLLGIADARLIARKAESRTSDQDAGWVRQLELPPEPAPAPPRPASRRRRHAPISRELLGSSTLLWRITGLVFIYYAAVAMSFRLLGVPQVSGPWTEPLNALGFAIGLLVLVTPAPPLHSIRSELTVALTYLVPAAAMLACAPAGATVIGFGIFVGPLVAVRTRTRRRAMAHLLAAFLVALVTCAFGGLDTASILALAMLALTEAVLAFYCIVVLEACERQGAELDRLSTLDPLTLLANRRRLEEQLEAWVDDARAGGGRLAVIALDLNGFKHLNDTLGHGAGDLLLVEVAGQLRRLAGPDALSARPGGDEFVLVLPGASLTQAADVADRVRAAVGVMDRHGCPVSTGVGMATYPADGASPEQLLAAADRRLIADKYGVAPSDATAA